MPRPQPGAPAPAPAPTWTPLTFHGGPLISRAEFVSLYWGAFTAAEITGMQTYLAGLADWISGGGAPAGQAPVLWQYETACARVGANYAVTQAPTTASDGDVHNQVLEQQIQGNLPGFEPNRLFLVFTKGIQFAGYGTVWCAYHSLWGDGQYYALCPFPEAGGCGDWAPIQSWQSVTCHEVTEAMTDPTIGGGWVEPGEEGGDVCAWQEVTLPFGTVQKFADNSQQACSVFTPVIPSFFVSSFSPWPGYVVPNGLWLPGDYNGDKRADIVHAVQGTDHVDVWTSNATASFEVTPFSPWAGYAIPNGLWLTGDYNGDGKADIVHAVQNADYVNVWLSKGDGTFTVKPFSPWAGYAIPNGLWLTGDYNGDGKADIVHAVQNTDYVNVWLSKGDGTFTVKPFSPWAGYAIPNGLWLVGDFNGDGKSDIVHAVQNTDYVNVWLSKGDGTFTVKPFSPWAGYAIPNGLWLVGDFNGDGKADIVHAVQGTNYVNVWLSKGDGTFTVKPFSPWAGYAIPNGLWLVGDFNGDGKADILHLVQGTDYANLWISKGDGTFTVTPFSPWAGYAIPNGLWTTGDFNGDTRTDVVHAVQNSSYVNTWSALHAGWHC